MFELTFLGTAASTPSPERGLPALLVAAGGSRFETAPRRHLDRGRLEALGVAAGPLRAQLAGGEAVVLDDGRRVEPDEVLGPTEPGASLAVVGDAEEVGTLVEPVRGADALV